MLRPASCPAARITRCTGLSERLACMHAHMPTVYRREGSLEGACVLSCHLAGPPVALTVSQQLVEEGFFFTAGSAPSMSVRDERAEQPQLCHLRRASHVQSAKVREGVRLCTPSYARGLSCIAIPSVGGAGNPAVVHPAFGWRSARAGFVLEVRGASRRFCVEI